jgi:hypothetical protein
MTLEKTRAASTYGSIRPLRSHYACIKNSLSVSTHSGTFGFSFAPPRRSSQPLAAKWSAFF